MDDVIRRILSVEGATSAEEVANLYESAQGVRDGCIVEVGSWRGRSTAALALGSKAGFGVPVYALDPHEAFLGIYGGTFGGEDRVHFFTNMLSLGVADIVRLVNLSSKVITPGWTLPVGLLWVDGDHRYRSTREDVRCWLPHLRPDATLVFDDAADERVGPYHVVEELVRGARWRRGPKIGKTKTLFRVPCETLDPAPAAGDAALARAS